MINQVGKVAGRIWCYLEENGKATVSKLTRELNESERTILMGIGWLAREDKLTFSTEGRFNYIALKDSESEDSSTTE